MNPRLSICVVGLIALGIATGPLWAQTTGSEKRLIILDESGQEVLAPVPLLGQVLIEASGDLRVTTAEPLDCGVEVTCDDVSVGSPGFTSLTATEVELGTILEFEWNSRGAWTCDAGGTLPGWNQRLGMHADSREAVESLRVVETEGLAPADPSAYPLTYNATLLCSNGPVQSDLGIPQSIPITLTAPPEPGADLPEECGSVNRRAPSDWTRLSTGSLSCHWDSSRWISGSDCREWGKVWPDEFDPNGTGTTRYLGLRSSHARNYIALQFNSGQFDPGFRGEFVVNTAPGLLSRRKIMTVSRCPGDFNEAAIRDKTAGGTGCMIESAINSLTWGGTGSARVCQLEPNTEYFLNIVYTEAPLGNLTWSAIAPHPDCVGERCGNLFRNR